MKVLASLPEVLRDEAADLYWQAFGGKLSRVMGPEQNALAFLHRVIRTDHCICALDDEGHLLGVAGFKSPIGGFVAGEREDMRAIYGRFGASWRMWLMRMLQSGVDNERFLIDGISVHPNHRSQGIGAELLRALIREAERRGYGCVRLEVVDTNLRARALYERMGFMPTGSETLGWLRFIFGFRRSTTMIYDMHSQHPAKTHTKDIEFS